MQNPKASSFNLSWLRPIVLLICVLGVAVFPGFSLKKAENSDIDTITEAELRGHIYYLASDFLEGRLPGSKGYKQASVYMASQLGAAGISPFMKDSKGKKSYFQPAVFVTSMITPESRLNVKTGGREIEWKLGEHFIPLLHGQEFKDGLFEAEAEFVGYGRRARVRLG